MGAVADKPLLLHLGPVRMASHSLLYPHVGAGQYVSPLIMKCLNRMLTKRFQALRIQSSAKVWQITEILLTVYLVALAGDGEAT